MKSWRWVRTSLAKASYLLGNQLGVTKPQSSLDWLVRLLVRPAKPGQPDAAAQYVEGIGKWCAKQLGMRFELPWYQWLRYLLVRPAPTESGSRWEGVSRQYHRFWDAVEWAWRGAKRVSAKIEQRLPKVNWDRAGQRFERLPRILLGRNWLWATLAMGGIWMAGIFITSPFNLLGQGAFFLTTWWASLLINRIPGRLPTLLLICISLMVSSRYIWWRTFDTMNMATPEESGLAMVLYAAEFYTWFVLLLGYVQTAWPLQRDPVHLPSDIEQWPSVDVFIPTYNEPMAVVKPTVFAALGLDWPHDKLKIYLLDDGRREAFRQFAEEVEVGYIVREKHIHAKAGNINHALAQTDSEYVAIFDCDHIPTRSFLQMSMGWLVKDPNCVLVQTPHHFFSPDPFERNFDTFRRVPNEGNLFYGLVQDGNDLWNATFFCGSCAVIRRAPLEEIGGIAVETVTEDAHTALKLHRRGYTSVYMRVIQAAGLATETLSSHIGQRIRWARGMAQIFRIDNPFFGRGLNLLQRLCYGNAMLHFFYGIPRLIFLTMPLCYLYFGYHVINAAALSICFYVMPHIFQASIANSRLQGKHRHSFWAEIYEAVLAWYIVLPTTMAFINPKYGKFNVTAKGGLIQESYFDWAISKPYLVLMGFNLAGLICGITRYWTSSTSEATTVTLNLVWTLFNLIMLGAAVGVATEAKQVRLAHRVPMRLPAVIYLRDGRTIACYTENYSLSGLGVTLADNFALAQGSQVWIGLNRGDREFTFPARVMLSNGKRLGLQFENLSTEEEMCLVQCTFGRADAWTRWDEDEEEDRPIMAFKEVLSLGLRGYRYCGRHVLNGLLGWMFPPLARKP